MSKVSSDIPETADIDFKQLKRRFIMLNQARLEQTHAALKENQSEFLELLPLLFHVNHPLLPGYVSRFTPCGVWGYEPRRKVLNAAKVLARSFAYTKPTRKRAPILAIYFMGSSGTIAHSEESDVDIWLCHDPKLGDDKLRELQQKAIRIETWAQRLGLEMHFFLINPEQFREGQVSKLSAESSGSAQHSLLLDEFYRTSVLLEGQYPLWWLVPPQYEAAYDLYVEEMHRKRFIYARDTIDFGGLAHVPAEEFFGAALWQLSKGIDSPYKAILKLLLLEVYAREYPAVELLSKGFKQAVYEGVVDPQQLDPYLMMLQKVSDYLEQSDEQQRLELARRCFYFKVAIPLSEDYGSEAKEWRQELLHSLTHSWNWSLADLMLMDSHHHWRIHRVLEERQILFQALTASYRFLSDFARKYSGLALISQEDLTTLGRKLYTAFERKAGKIDIITHGIEAELKEQQVTVVEMINDGGENSWQLYNGVVNLDNLRLESPIKRTRSLIELLAWCHFNRITGEHGRYVVHSGYSGHETREVEALANRIAHQFPTNMLERGGMQDYASAATLLQCEFYINIGVRLPEKMMITRNLAATGQTDPFGFGYKSESLVLSLEQLSVNSWHEAIADRFLGSNAVLDALCNYLKWYPPMAGEIPPLPGFFTGPTALGTSTARRMEGLFRDVIEQFYGEEADSDARYIVTIGPNHYCFYFDEGIPRYKVLQSTSALSSFLSQLQEKFSPLYFDSRSLKESFLPVIYSRNEPGKVQLFFYAKDGTADVYVLDEKGSLFHQRVPFYDEKTLLNQYSRFFEAVSNRINFLLLEGQMHSTIDGVAFYRLTRDTLGRRRVTNIAQEFYHPENNYFSLQVIVEQNSSGESIFTLYCDGKEFSTLEHGKGLFDSVVDHMLMLRNSGQRYPIYITDISLDRSVVGEGNVGRMQSSYFLNYKSRIEAQLNQAMER